MGGKSESEVKVRGKGVSFSFFKRRVLFNLFKAKAVNQVDAQCERATPDEGREEKGLLRRRKLCCYMRKRKRDRRRRFF